jgi:hypothetical protein
MKKTARAQGDVRSASSVGFALLLSLGLIVWREAPLAVSPSGVERHCFMKPLSGDKQLGLVSPLESAAGQSNQTNNPSKDEVGLDVSHHTRIFLRGGENLFFLTSSFIG